MAGRRQDLKHTFRVDSKQLFCLQRSQNQILCAESVNHPEGTHMETPQLVGISEIADFARVTRQAVANWRARYDSFPRPIQNLQSGPVWERENVEKWVKS